MLLGFTLGLLCGFALLVLGNLRHQKHLRQLLQELRPNGSASSLPLYSQLLAAIASQRNYSQTLKSRIHRYQFMLANAPIAFLHVDDENRLVWCNPLAQKLFNISQSHYPEPRLLIELVRSYELDTLIEQIRQSGQTQEQEWVFYPLNTNPARVMKQKSYPLKGFGLPLFNNHVGIFIENRQDIALLKQQRDRWTSDVAHELKTPLTSIRLIAETLQPRLEPSLVRWADRLIDQSTRLSDLVQDLLDLSQLEGQAQRKHSGHDGLDIGAVNLPDLIESVWFGLEPISSKKNIQFCYEGPAELIFFADESRMYRVMTNLLDNSIKYSPAGAKIHVMVQVIESEALVDTSAGIRPMRPDSDYWVQIKVMDAGPGFIEDDLPHIFERFYRADPARSRSEVSPLNSPPANGLHLTEQPNGQHHQEQSESHLISQAYSPPSPASTILTPQSASRPSHPGGTGLGLAIVQQIIDAHGGLIEARNRQTQSGAIICISLPMNEDSA